MSWRRFLFVHELLHTFDEEAAVAAVRANTTSLVKHLVEFLSEWIVTFVEPGREITKAALLLDWSDVSARTIAPKARKIEERRHR